MQNEETFSLISRIKSFKYAAHGIREMIISQHNAWIHLLMTVLAMALGFYFKIDRTEWCLIVLAIVSVWVAEGVNTAIEHLSDAVSMEHHPLIKSCKDIAAGAVLICAIGAVIIGILVFYPYLFNF